MSKLMNYMVDLEKQIIELKNTNRIQLAENRDLRKKIAGYKSSMNDICKTRFSILKEVRDDTPLRGCS